MSEVIRENLGDVKDLSIYYEGSGDPSEEHRIIGIRFNDGDFKYIGNMTKMRKPDKVVE